MAHRDRPRPPRPCRADGMQGRPGSARRGPGHEQGGRGETRGTPESRPEL